MLGNKEVENCYNVWKTLLSFCSDQFFGQLENYVKRVFSVIIVDSADDVKNLLWNLFRNFIFEICWKLMQIVHGNQSLIPLYCSILVSFQLQVWYLININARLVLGSRSIIYLRWVKLKFTSWDKKKSIGTQKLKKTL